MYKKISLIGLVVNLVLGIAKIMVGIISNSSSVIAEGLHSGMDVISSGINYVGISASKKPADKKHPYGYYKAEVISGFMITIILFLTASWIIYESIISFLVPKEIAITYVTAAVMIVSAIANEIMSRLKIKYGKKYDLISLISDGIHSKVDVLTSVAVLIGLILSRYFIYADSIIAFLIGLYILKESFTLGRKATDSLLDISAGDEIENRIETIVKGEEIKIQDMKTQKRGSKISAEINIRLPKNLKVNEASAITKKLEKKLIDNIDNLEHVTIQITSHEISESYFKGLLGAGMGWQRRGRMDGKGLGVYGSCVCPKCGHKTEHIRGVPCTSRKCPKCNTKMERDDEDGKTTETQKSRV